MKAVRQILSLLWLACRLRLKAAAAYRLNWVVGLVGQTCFSALSLVFLFFFLPAGTAVGGWHIGDFLLMLGLGDVAFGLAAGLFFRLFLVFDSEYILYGRLDSALTQPAAPLVWLAARTMNPLEIITVVKGMLLIGFGWCRLGAGGGWLTLGGVCFFAVTGAVVYSGIFLILLATGFWMQRRTALSAPFLSINQLGQMPLFIYPEAVRLLLTAVVPIGFVAYYPVASLKHTLSGSWLPLTVAVAFVTAGAGLWLFARGLKRYEGAGH